MEILALYKSLRTTSFLPSKFEKACMLVQACSVLSIARVQKCAAFDDACVCKSV